MVEHRKSILLVLLFLLAGCISQPAATFEPTVILMPSQISTMTAVQVPTQTSTLVPTIATTPLPTWTPLPTLSPRAGLKTFYSWLKGSENCHLPCWAGMIPGQTIWTESRQLIESISVLAELDVFRDETCSFGGCNEIRWSFNDPLIGVGYIYSQLPEDKIHLIRMEISDSYLVKSLGLKDVLNQYGKPAILMFYTDPDQPGQYKNLQLTMVYPEHQFIIKYDKNATLAGKNIVSCGADSVINLLILDNKEQLMSESAIENSIETKNFPVSGAWLKSAEESLGMTMDEFYETFRKAGAPCITTPVEIWMP